MQVNLKSNIIGTYRGVLTQLINAMNTHNELAKKFNAMALTLADGDFTDANAGITAAEFTAAYNAVQAIETLLSSNSSAQYGAIFKVQS